MSRAPEVLVQNYKGAKIYLLLTSGTFKAEFGHADKTIRGDSLPSMRQKIDASIEPVEIPGGADAILFHDQWHPPERVRVLAVKKTERGSAFLVEKPDGSTALHGEVHLPDPSFLAAIDAFAVAHAANAETEGRLREARDKMYGARDAFRVGPASVERLLPKAAE